MKRVVWERRVRSAGCRFTFPREWTATLVIVQTWSSFVASNCLYSVCVSSCTTPLGRKTGGVKRVGRGLGRDLRAGFSFEKASFWGFFGFDAPPKPIFLRFWHRRVGLGSRMVLFSGKFLRCLQLAKAKGRRSVCSNEGSLEQTFVSGTSALTTRGPSTTAPVSAPGRWHWPRLLALPQCINDASYQ